MCTNLQSGVCAQIYSLVYVHKSGVCAQIYSTNLQSGVCAQSYSLVYVHKFTVWCMCTNLTHHTSWFERAGEHREFSQCVSVSQCVATVHSQERKTGVSVQEPFDLFHHVQGCGSATEGDDEDAVGCMHTPTAKSR